MDPIDNGSDTDLPPPVELTKSEVKRHKNAMRMRKKREDAAYKEQEKKRRQERRAKAKRDSNRLQPHSDEFQIAPPPSDTSHFAAQSIPMDLPGPENEGINGETFLVVWGPLLALCVIICGCYRFRAIRPTRKTSN